MERRRRLFWAHANVRPWAKPQIAEKALTREEKMPTMCLASMLTGPVAPRMSACWQSYNAFPTWGWVSIPHTHTHTQALWGSIWGRMEKGRCLSLSSRERERGDNTLIGNCSSIYKWAYQLEFSWLEEEGSPTLMAVDTGWTLLPSCPSSGVGNTGPPVPRDQTPSWLS